MPNDDEEAKERRRHLIAGVVKARRLELGRTQVEVIEAARDAMGASAVSEPTYRALEKARTDASALTLSAVSRGLDWPAHALARIADGIDVAAATGRIEEPFSMDASGADLAELAESDPEYYAQLNELARLHLRSRG